MEKNNPATVRGWVMYDWANSVYSLTIATAVFPGFYESVTHTDSSDVVYFFGKPFVNTALYAYAVSFFHLIAAIIAPILGGIADYRDNKLAFLKAFVYMGSAACAALFFFQGGNVEWGIIAFIIAGLGFTGSLVFYNAYLPEIVSPDRLETVSARGYSMGYIGSVILLIFNLFMIMKPEIFGITDPKLPAQISFLTVAIWWAGFAQITFKTLPKRREGIPYKSLWQIVGNGHRTILEVWKKLTHYPALARFLTGFFIYSMGLQTVMFVASIFGKKEIGLEMSQLIITVLIIQLVAVGGSIFFARLSKRIGNMPAIMVALVIWIGICVGAYFVRHGNFTGFYALGAAVGWVMGGIQALSRATYARLLPETEDHASFFSFYDSAEKIAIVLGTFIYGFIEEFTGSMRNSILVLISFFVVGLILIYTARGKALQRHPEV